MGKRRKKATAQTISDQLRQFIEDSGIPRNQLCKMTGMDPSHLHRFFHGTGRLTNDTMDSLAEALGLRLVRDE
jgi:hypothetical protein